MDHERVGTAVLQGDHRAREAGPVREAESAAHAVVRERADDLMAVDLSPGVGGLDLSLNRLGMAVRVARPGVDNHSHDATSVATVVAGNKKPRTTSIPPPERVRTSG